MLDVPLIILRNHRLNFLGYCISALNDVFLFQETTQILVKYCDSHTYLKANAGNLVTRIKDTVRMIIYSILHSTWQQLNRRSYMSAHVLLNLLNELGKIEKNARLAEHFISFSQRV